MCHNQAACGKSNHHGHTDDLIQEDRKQYLIPCLLLLLHCQCLLSWFPFLSSSLNVGGEKKTNHTKPKTTQHKKPSGALCNSCWLWRTDLPPSAQLLHSWEARAPSCLFHFDRPRLPGVLLTYLCTMWVIPTATNKSYYLSSTSLDSAEWLTH